MGIELAIRTYYYRKLQASQEGSRHSKISWAIALANLLPYLAIAVILRVIVLQFFVR